MSGDLGGLSWTYNQHSGLHVEAKAGFLTTATGDGGFNLRVGTDGQWQLSFDGSDKVIGNKTGHDQSSVTPPPPPGNTTVTLPAGASVYNAAAGHITTNGGTGWDTVQGGVGDYMIGGSGTLGGGLPGRGNCALYSASPGSVLVDMQNGFGYGSNAEGNVYVNMNQVRGASSYSNVLIGSSLGTDLKSGGSNSLLISTGGTGFELRPDGSGNVLVSTAGNDRIVFDPTHGWALGDDNIVLGFNAAPGHDSLDLSLLTATVRSNFHTASAAGYDASTGHGDITKYVSIVDQSDGSHVFFNATGNVAGAGVELATLDFVHGLNVQTMFAQKAIVA